MADRLLGMAGVARSLNRGERQARGGGSKVHVMAAGGELMRQLAATEVNPLRGQPARGPGTGGAPAGGAELIQVSTLSGDPREAAC